jgi:hypothetical protein
MRTLLVACLLAVAVPAIPQKQTEKLAIYVTGSGPAAPVAQSLIKMLNESKPFTAVGPKEPSKVAVLISCMEPKQTGPFFCMYVSHVSGPSFKTLLGGGNYVSMNADIMATNFLASIIQDIVEKYDDTNIENLRQDLEACLLLSDSKCNVPDPLQKEFGEKQLTLGQYLLQKNK